MMIGEKEYGRIDLMEMNGILLKNIVNKLVFGRTKLAVIDGPDGKFDAIDLI